MSTGNEHLNCWEAKACGREPGGVRSSEFGPCPAATESRADGINRGSNGGRACWAIAGTLCGGTVQGSFARKLGNCWRCDFYNRVMQEEGPSVVLAQGILAALR